MISIVRLLNWAPNARADRCQSARRFL